MSVDRSKVLEAAQKHLAKGAYDKAIAEYRKLVQADPSDVRTWLKIGDLQTRKGARGEAIETYARVASFYGEQGFFSKGLAVYKQILKLDPSRLDIQLKLAEMYEMLDLVGDALSTYEHVAAGYARAGDIARAIGTLQKMTVLDPENIPVRIKCAEALSKAGKVPEAAKEFEAGAKLLKQQGRMDDYIKVAERLLYHRPEAVAVARELSELYLARQDPKRALSKLQLCFKADPKDIPTLELLAEAFHQLGQLPKTISVYKEVARIHQEAGRDEPRAKILKRILELDPGDREARQALAGYAAQEPVRRDIQPPASAVVAPSQRPPAPEPDEPELEEIEDLEALDAEMVDAEMVDAEMVDAEVLDPEVVDPEVVNPEVVQVYEVDEAEEVLLVDGDSEAPPAEAAEIDIAIASSAPPPPEPAREPPPPEPTVGAPSVPPDVQREAQIARLLTECEVFLRYGLKAKVAEQLAAVLEIDPNHVEARERLKDLYLSEGRTDEAIAQLFALADVLSVDQSTAAKLYVRQVLEIDPDNAEAQRRLEAMPSLSPPAVASAPASAFMDEAPATGDERLLEEDDDVFFVDEEAEPGAMDLDDATEAGEPMPGATRMDAAPFADDDAAPRHAVPPPAALPGAVMPPPAAGSAPPVDPLAPMTPEEFEDVPLRPSTPGQVMAETSQRLSMPPGEVEEILEEADFFIAQGLAEEARGTLTEALNSFPDHPLILEKLGEVRALSEHAQLRQSQRPSGEVDLDQSFELAEKLAQDFGEVEDTQAGSDVLDVEEVFAQFKAGVQAQVGAEDTDTHFDLGIAYKEMGLLDDAIGEFKLCLSNPSRRCIAETMIGLCHIEKGEVSAAIGHFKKGLYADQKTDREELGLYFELGRAYELISDPKEALYYFQKVSKRDPDFRDVKARIEALSRPQVEVPAATAAMGRDDIDRAFDDLMGED